MSSPLHPVLKETPRKIPLQSSCPSVQQLLRRSNNMMAIQPNYCKTLYLTRAMTFDLPTWFTPAQNTGDTHWHAAVRICQEMSRHFCSSCLNSLEMDWRAAFILGHVNMSHPSGLRSSLTNAAKFKTMNVSTYHVPWTQQRGRRLTLTL